MSAIPYPNLPRANDVPVFQTSIDPAFVFGIANGQGGGIIYADGHNRQDIMLFGGGINPILSTMVMGPNGYIVLPPGAWPMRFGKLRAFMVIDPGGEPPIR